MKIYIGADHAGFELKQKLIDFLELNGHEVVDKGAYELDEKDDYPDFVFPVAKSVSSDEGSFGVVIGGSGQGETIAANRIKGVRAALYHGGRRDVIRLSREHNDANILGLGARLIDEDTAKEALQTFLSTDFSGDERHIRRIAKLDNDL